jgi:hypothetical protein
MERPLWASDIFGSQTACNIHGNQHVIERGEYSVGTYYDDGTRDAGFTEWLECGCILHCREYRNEIMRYPVGGTLFSTTPILKPR